MESLPSEEGGAWELNEGALEKLLSHLDPDREAAGEKYVRLQLRLSSFFEQRRFSPPDEHAGVVLDRLARKFDEGEAVQNATGYALGIARLYALELSRRPVVEGVDDWGAVPVSAERLAAGRAQEPDGEDARLSCLDRCLDRLPAQERRMVIGYYQDDKRAKIDNRRELSSLLGINMNTLRIRVMRTQRRLEKCVTDCEAGR